MAGVLALAVGYAAATPGTPSGGPLTVTASPPSSKGGGFKAPRTCPPVTAYVSGGSGSYTYAWTIELMPFGTLTIVNPSGRSTGFAFAAGDVTGDATVRVTVTDTATSETGFADVSVTYVGT